MTEEPKHAYWGISASEKIANYPRYLSDWAVGFWQIVIDGRRWFGLGGDELTDYVRRSLYVLVDSGAKPVKADHGKNYCWILQSRYGTSTADVIDGVIAEWLSSGGCDPDLTGLWFALPEIYQTAGRQDGLHRILDFLNFLNQKKIEYYIERHDEEGLRATFTLVGARVEAVFTVEDMTFRIFKGREDVIIDEKVLYALIKEHIE